MDDFEEHLQYYTVEQEDGLLLNNVTGNNYYDVEHLKPFFHKT